MSAERVRALLGDPALARLVDRLESRIRLGQPLTGPLSLDRVTPEEQAAIARLLGRGIRSGRTATVRLDQVAAAVAGSGAARDLAEAVVLLRGPVPVAAEVAAAEAAVWEAVLRPAEDLAAGRPEFAALPTAMRRSGALRRAAAGSEDAARIVQDVAAVLGALPATGETLPAFAARVLHDAHGLDAGPVRSFAEAVLPGDRPADRWAAVGVALDALSSSVLVHALPFATDEPVGAALDALGRSGQPVLVTLRMLLGAARPAAEEVFVCENPAVVAAAADAFGSECAPMVCVRGQPSAAAQRLLRLLADDGAVLRYHGDFDWGGLRIANRIVERFGAVPWRYTAADHGAASVQGRPLAGTRVEATWDPGLAAAIEERGTRVEEEQVLDDLLGDLHVRPGTDAVLDRIRRRTEREGSKDLTTDIVRTIRDARET